MPMTSSFQLALRGALIGLALLGFGNLSAEEGAAAFARNYRRAHEPVELRLLCQDRGTDQYGLSRTYTLIQAARRSAQQPAV